MYIKWSRVFTIKKDTGSHVGIGRGSKLREACEQCMYINSVL